MNDIGDDGTGCFDIKEWADTTGVDECESCRIWIVQLSGQKKKGVHRR